LREFGCNKKDDCVGGNGVWQLGLAVWAGWWHEIDSFTFFINFLLLFLCEDISDQQRELSGDFHILPLLSPPT
jgi:hypothetical protein